MKESNYGKRSPMSKKAKKMTGYIIGIWIMVAMIVFFTYYKVDSVEVTGTTHYTDEEVKNMVLQGAAGFQFGPCTPALQHKQIQRTLHLWMHLR